MTWILLWLVAAAVVAVIVGNIIAAGRSEQVAIRIQDMTDAQLQAKADEYRAMGAGCFQHADEIDRYRAQASRENAA